ncbi:MAG TPA: ferritin-like domain-containing protein [Steroidobacteraceae bacterium]|nr:ferritin-like domain-containing protein [Steroidobacteraceae bacterium]
MDTSNNITGNFSREVLLYALYEAAELEHNLMCTYLYAAFSLKSGVSDGLRAEEAETVARWRREIISVAIDEMSHLTAVWNITSALGGTPRFGRANFPLDPGLLPARVVVKLAPFNEAVLQHFIYLERPEDSTEADGDGFAPERLFERTPVGSHLTPMGINYLTVGEFYRTIADGLRNLVARVGEPNAFCGDPNLQLSASEVDLPGAKQVICIKTALAAFDAIVAQGEGAPLHTAGSHFGRFCEMRREYQALKAKNPAFSASHPAATNPVLRRPPRPEGRVWIETPAAIATVDLANACYGLLLRLLAYSYGVPAPHPDKALAVDLAIALMQAVTPLGEQAARIAAGPSNPLCNAGMSFTTLRDAAPLPFGPAARRFFVERLAELKRGATALAAGGESRPQRSAQLLDELARRAAQRFDLSAAVVFSAPAIAHDAQAPKASEAPASSTVAGGVEIVEGGKATLQFETKRCIHARFCVTGAPSVFLANVQGPWIHPDTIDVERLAAVAEECPSGAIRLRRKDGRPDEAAPPVNLASIRESGPYSLRGQLRLDGVDIGYRATLCRCGASKNKPFCDSSHHEVNFSASGEPASTRTEMLPVRNGLLAIDPQSNGPLQVRGNLEIISGTGRVVARVTNARLCRCGASAAKPFCDGTHARIGFRS